MTINESFQLLNSRIQPTENEVQAARQHYATIRTRLETEFEVSKCVAVGSFARGTSIHDFSDIDLLAVFRKTVFTWGDDLISSDTALEKVRVALAERYPNSDVYKDGIAIAVSFSDGQHVDVVPGVFDSMYRDKWPVYLIPDNAGGWMQTIYVAQLIKFWRECREPRIPLSSFHIEMVLAYEEVCKVATTYADCMLEILRNLARRECRAMRDPYGIAGNIPAVKSESQRERSLASIINSRDHAASAVYADSQGDIQEARRQWDIVFNTKFPW
jgi:predicted nucleotidyltransferase